MAVQAVTDATFEAEVLRSELPVLVDLYADWCQPCKQLAPIVAEVAVELAGKIKVVNVDVDSNPMVAQTFRAQSPRSAAEVRSDELAAWMAQGKAVPVDIRDAASYGRYRIPSAIHIPASELAGRVEELRPFDGRVRVLYGRSEEAKEWGEKLQADGVQVGFLSGGFLHWEADGHEVERG
jgi:thiol-disulfide isomerase/thioredoxin